MTEQYSNPRLPTKFSPRHRKIAIMIAGGFTNKEILAAVGGSDTYLSELKQWPQMQQEVEQYSRQIEEKAIDKAADLVAKFDDESPKAFKTVRSLHREGNSEAVRLRAAKDILDRAPIAPKTKAIHENKNITPVIVFTAEESKRIDEAFKIVEGDYEEVDDGMLGDGMNHKIQ